MPYPVEGFLQFSEEKVQILLMLDVLFTQDSEVEILFHGAFSGSEAPACSSAIISLTWGLRLFKMTLSMTFLE